ncbi:class I SAM-dependent methyltransferase [Stieleria varia]|uniref:class I SAM-dependent methyltransferase n=1 Tax=Stieleria varia TaxID=2528005 RepID=UPI001E47237A|nr:class I SAM-dependent methyltransferase [Stieleria varia]
MTVDQILDRERIVGDPAFLQSLVLVYGAWWGEYLALHFGGQWTGVSEPTPPKLLIGGVIYSPLDAVRRRLTDPSSPSLNELSAALRRDKESSNIPIQQQNRQAWDDKANDPRFVFSGILPESRQEALQAVDPWLRDEVCFSGGSLLCLAAGGGTHGPLHAIAGANVTVVDFSSLQLSIDRLVAQRMGLSLQLIEASMDDLSMLGDATFDAVLHPVSLCYVADVWPVYREIARVLKPSGVYFSQQKQPGSLQATDFDPASGFRIAHPCDEGRRLPGGTECNGYRETGTVEFVHGLDMLLGGLCRSGFMIEEISEPPRGDAWAPEGSLEHRARFLPPYLKIRARRNGQSIGLRR